MGADHILYVCVLGMRRHSCLHLQVSLEVVKGSTDSSGDILQEQRTAGAGLSLPWQMAD